VSTVASVAFAALTIGIVTAAMLDLHATSGAVGFGTAFIGAFVLTLTFDTYDLVILDWLVIVTLRPKLVVLPGTEGMPAYGDLKFHTFGFLKGLIGARNMGQVGGCR